MRAGHADVGLIGGAVLEDLLVGGGDVGVRAQHGRDAAVEVAAEELLVAGRLGVDVDQDHPRLAADLAEDAVGGAERVSRPAACRSGPAAVKTATGVPSRALTQASSAPGESGGKLAGRSTSVGPVEELEDLVLAVDVVAHGHDVDAGLGELLVARSVSPEPPAAFSALQTTRPAPSAG